MGGQEQVGGSWWTSVVGLRENGNGRPMGTQERKRSLRVLKDTQGLFAMQSDIAPLLTASGCPDSFLRKVRYNDVLARVMAPMLYRWET